MTYDVLLGDRDDRYHTAEATFTGTTATGPATVGTEVFTGERIPLSNDSDEFEVGGAYYKQSPSDMEFNSGRTFVIGPSFAYGITIGRGSNHMYSQDIIYDNMKLAKFKSKATNK